MLLVLGVPYAVALGLLVALLDLIPLAGATLAAIIVVDGRVPRLADVGDRRCSIFFIVYQQLENHVLQPLVYGRTVQLSPLVVLIAVLIGAELAGVLGALGAIPVAGTIQVLFVDWLKHRADAGRPPPSRARSPSPRRPDAPGRSEPPTNGLEVVLQLIVFGMIGDALFDAYSYR